jgi:hypothetical protein
MNGRKPEGWISHAHYSFKPTEKPGFDRMGLRPCVDWSCPSGYNLVMFTDPETTCESGCFTEGGSP